MISTKNACEPQYFERNLGIYHLKMEHNTSELRIDMENIENSRVFTTIVKNEKTGALTSTLFENSDELFHGIVDAIESKSNSLRITIGENDEGCRILYWCEYNIGKRTKSQSFEFSVEEVKLDETSKALRVITKHTKDIIELKKTIEILTQNIIDQETKYNQGIQSLEANYAQKLKELETKNAQEIQTMRDQLKGKPIKDTPSVFDPNSAYASQHILLNSNRTAVCKISGSYRPLIGAKALPKDKVSSFSVRIDKTDTNAHMMIGICPTSLKNTANNLYSQNGSISLYTNGSCSIYSKGSSAALSFIAVCIGTVIKVRTDFNKKEVSFFYDDHLLKTIGLDDQFLQGDYFPFVELATQYDKVSFVDYDEE